MKQYRKATVAVVGAVVAVLAAFGVVVPAEASNAVITAVLAVTSLLVWRVPNED